MNPRQRRGALLMIVAGIGAIAVFFSVVAYVNDLRGDLGEYRTVLMLNTDVTAYQPITEDMVEEEQVPAKFFKDTFVSDLSQIVDQAGSQPVSSSYIEEGTLLQTSMVIPAPELDTGEREIAIMVDAETGVAGKVSRQSRVDIYGTFTPQETDDQSARTCAVRVLTDVEVLEVGEIGSQTDDNTGAESAVVPVTFRLDPQDTLQLTYAESFAGNLRLGLVSPQGSGDPGGLEFCSDDLEDIREQGGDS